MMFAHGQAKTFENLLAQKCFKTLLRFLTEGKLF